MKKPNQLATIILLENQASLCNKSNRIYILCIISFLLTTTNYVFINDKSLVDACEKLQVIEFEMLKKIDMFLDSM